MGTRLTDVILVVSSAHYSRASEVISCLDRVHQLKKHEVKPSSLYLRLILEQVRVCVCVCVCEERERGGNSNLSHLLVSCYRSLKQRVNDDDVTESAL